METGMAEAEGSNEDITGKKKSKLKVLKTRLFGRMKRKETEGLMKQSQSASDVTAEAAGDGGVDSRDEFLHATGRLGSRAMSHDSIFLADEGQAPAEPGRNQSQENVQGKIKALQMKLQQQNLHLGPPPLLIPGKRAEDTGVSSEDDGLPHSPPEISFSSPEGLARVAPKFPDTHRNLSSLSLAGTGSEEEEQGYSQPPSHPLSPGTKLAPPTSPAVPSGVDFDSPAHFTPCLDSSAARHRMSIKPRNQRASAKGRRLPTDSRPRSESLNALDRPVLEKDEEEDDEVPKDAVRLRSYSTQVIRSGEGAVLRDTVRGALRLSEDGLGVGHTDTDRRDSSDPGHLDGQVTMNPLFQRPMPQGLDNWGQQVLGAGGTPPNSSEVQKLLEAKSPGVRDSVREVAKDTGRRDSVNTPPAPSKTPSPTPASPLPVSEMYLTKAPKKSFQDMAQEPLWAQPLPKTQSLPTPPAATPLLSAAPRTSSLKRNSVDQTQQEGPRTEPSQSVTAPPAASEDQTPPEGAKPQRPNSGSFRFSIASAWDRPRGGSLLGKEERRVAKEEVLAGKPEEAKPKPEPLNPASAGKAEGGLPAKSSFGSRREEQAVAASEEVKPRDQARNAAALQERTDPNGKGKEGSLPKGPARVTGNGGRDSWVKQVAMETAGRAAEEGKDWREPRSGGLEEEGEGEKDERTAFGVKLRSTSLSVKYRQREAPNPELKSLSAEGCPQAQSRDPQGGLMSQACNPPGGLLGQSRDPKVAPLSQSHDIQRGPLGQSRDFQGGPFGQSRDNKCPDPPQQHNGVVRGGQPLRLENNPEHASLKPPLQRKRTSSNSDTRSSPADPCPTPSGSTKCDLIERQRPGDPKPQDDVDLPTDLPLDTGPTPKPTPAPPKEAEPVVSEPVASEPAASEPAWMTMAREKTRSLQQLFASRLPREFTGTTTTPAPKPAPQATPHTPVSAPTPQPAALHPPPPAVLAGRGDRAPQETAKRTAPAQRGTPVEKKKNERTPRAEGTVPPADKRPERTDLPFPGGGKTDPTATLPETLSTAATAPHRAEAKMEGRATCKVHTSETTPSSTPVQSREREDRQPIRSEASAAAPAVSSGGQPSWMELAKRKSLAWSDKTMD